MTTILLERCDALAKQMIADRRDFHRYAESGWSEFRTTSIIIARLQTLGLPVYYGTDAVHPDYAMGRPDDSFLEQQQQRAIAQGADPILVQNMRGYTGAVAVLDTQRPGPTIALRFEIDSNDLQECCTMDHRPYADKFHSVNPGFQHACAHDGHTAIGLAVAQILVEHRHELCGTIRFIFQPAEEGVRGARSMIQAGWLDDVDYYLSGHVHKDPMGVIYCGTNNLLFTEKIDAQFIGKSAHAGACPQEGKNALLAACAATMSLHSLTQDSRGTARVNVGVFQAGTGRNVIPEQAQIKIETRGETNEISQTVSQNAMNVLNGAAVMYGVQLQTKLAGAAIGADSDERLVQLIKQYLSEAKLGKELIRIRMATGSDDTSEMMLKVQSQGGLASHLAWGGSATAPAHNNRFDFDENVLPLAAKTICTIVARLMPV